MYQNSNSAFTRDERNAVEAAALVGLGAPIATGIIAGTKVETDAGWVGVETLMAGTKVQTYAGLRRVAAVTRSYVEPGNPLTCPGGLLLVPGGALNNCAAFYLLPDQLVLLETIYAEEVFGDACSLVPGSALEGFRGITLVRPHGLIEVITPVFDVEDVVYGNTGVLFHCASTGAALGKGLRSDYFLTLTEGQARALLALLEAGAEEADDLVWAYDRLGAAA